MDAINEVLTFLERHTDFSKDLADLVQRPQWPAGWLSSYQLAQEVERFGFWNGLRSRIPQETRTRLLDRFLQQAADDEASGWTCVDDQYKFNPTDNDIDNGKAVTNPDSQRRRHGRVQCEMLTCQFGPVANLSASGVMVIGIGKPQHQVDDRVPLNLTCLDHRVSVTARVAWTRPTDTGYRMGLEFTDMTAEQAQTIRELLPIAAAVQTVGDRPGSDDVTHYGR